MLSGNLWPVHPHPSPDELLSSWLVRIAHGNGEKVQSFCHHEFGIERQIWNRDIDRQAPEWLLTILSERTATMIERVKQTTLKRYEGVLFDHYVSSGVEKWIMPLRIYHRTRKSHGLQFCPVCLKEDVEPYFRTQWRLALHTFCPKHQVMLHDCCPCCGESVVFQRIELGKGKDEAGLDKKLSTCFNCGFDLALSKAEKPIFINQEIADTWLNLLSELNENRLSSFDLEQLGVLHHFCKLLTSKVTSKKLLAFISSNLSTSSIPEPNMALRHFEANDVAVRHGVFEYAWWLLLDWPNNLYSAWLNGAIRYNQLLKDYRTPPIWFLKIVTIMNLSYKKRLRLKQNLKN
ncbi:MAG: TniQ family protein [Methyloprofundus sp.]|nr:TniQ family protein [Methyloprofundus sp.]